MKWLLTSVTMSRESRRRIGKAGVSVVDTTDLHQRGIIRTPNMTVLQVEQWFEESRSGRETITKVVDVRPADGGRR